MDLACFQRAQKSISSYLSKTPLVRSYSLEEELQFNGRIFLKCEHLNETGSFKIRGALLALLQLSSEEMQRGVITRSSGNFAKALAYAGKLLGVSVTIIMPSNAPDVKKLGAVKYGAYLVLTDSAYDKQQEMVSKLAQEKNLTVLHPFNHLAVIEGAGTIGLEVWEDLPTVGQYFCPIGGGGLMSGSASALGILNPEIEIIGVEPEGANDYFLSRQKGERVCLEKTNTIADGLRAPMVGEYNWPLLQKYVARVVCVKDEEIVKAMAFLYQKMGMVVEPSGVVSVAALFHKENLKEGSDVVSVLTGGNIDQKPCL